MDDDEDGVPFKIITSKQYEGIGKRAGLNRKVGVLDIPLDFIPTTCNLEVKESKITKPDAGEVQLHKVSKQMKDTIKSNIFQNLMPEGLGKNVPRGKGNVTFSLDDQSLSAINNTFSRLDESITGILINKNNKGLKKQAIKNV